MTHSKISIGVSCRIKERSTFLRKPLEVRPVGAIWEPELGDLHTQGWPRGLEGQRIRATKLVSCCPSWGKGQELCVVHRHCIDNPLSSWRLALPRRHWGRGWWPQAGLKWHFGAQEGGDAPVGVRQAQSGFALPSGLWKYYFLPVRYFIIFSLGNPYVVIPGATPSPGWMVKLYSPLRGGRCWRCALKDNRVDALRQLKWSTVLLEGWKTARVVTE